MLTETRLPSLIPSSNNTLDELENEKEQLTKENIDAGEKEQENIFKEGEKEEEGKHNNLQKVQKVQKVQIFL